MTPLFCEQLNIKFLAYWPEAGGDLYQDNETLSSFTVSPEENLEEKLSEVRNRFKAYSGSNAVEKSPRSLAVAGGESER
jgi:hypothetical protein